MTTQRPAAGRRLHRAVSLAAALLLASLPLVAQNRSRPSGSGATGRTAQGAGSTRPSYSPPPSSTPSSPSGGNRSSTSSPPRTARPSDGGEPHRQPSHGRGGSHHNGGHGHVGHYYGGYGGYYPYYYPYGWGYYGFWPGFYGWWGYPYYGYGYGYGGYPYHYGYGGEGAGALDFDVAPARTEIYLDGQYVGKVDGFDGWPRYLWLPKGTYDVVLYLDGYKTVARQISVYPGAVVPLDDRMEPGESVRPENLVSKSTVRRDERMRYERERSEEVDREEHGGDDYGEEWRDRVRRDRMEHPDQEADEEVDRSPQKGRLVLEVYPQDASVYLDGRFVGTGSDLKLMREGLPVSPGEHNLAVVRPGRKAEERDFDVEAGEAVELAIELKSESR